MDRSKRYLPHPEVRIALFLRNMTITEAAGKIGRSRAYLSGSIGRSYPMSRPMAAALTDLLGIEVLPERREART